jgi:drug/metabolite transporter (DMT)-like permease
MFYVIAVSSQKVGVTVTTIASKMSVIIPILFSILYYSEEVNAFKIVGISLAIIAVIFTIYKKKSSNFNVKLIVLPILLFVGMGLVDLFVKYSQQEFIDDSLSALFSAILFMMAGITGVVTGVFSKKVRKSFTNYKVYLFGIILGLVNFGSIYFLINALNSGVLDSSVLFGVNNVGIVGLSVIIGLLVFKEKVTKINWVGIVLSFIAIIILIYARS